MSAHIHDKLGSTSLKERCLWTIVLFAVLFFTVVTFSYYFLPEGLLKHKNPLQNWETSKNAAVSALQIFGYNMISVLVILAAGLFGQKKPHHRNYLSIGYVAFFALICQNAVVLGTWSFSVERVSIPLFARLLQTFDLVHRAGLWEMMGQLCITCAAARSSIILTNGNVTETRKRRSVPLSKSERRVLCLGVALMVIGAVVESTSILFLP